MHFFINLQIRRKIYLLVLLALLAAVLVGVKGYFSTRDIARNQNVLFEHYQSLVCYSDIESALLTARGDVRNMMLQNTPADREKYRAIFMKDYDKVEAGLAKAGGFSSGPAVRQEYEKLIAAWNRYKQLRDRAIPFALAMQDKEALAILDTDARQSLAVLRAALRRICEIEMTESTLLDERADQSASSSLVWIASLLILGMVTVSVLAIYMARLIATPLQDLTITARELAEGNTHYRIEPSDRRDEIGLLQSSFVVMMQNIRLHADEAKQIAQGNLDTDITVASEHDTLARELIQMVETIKTLIHTLQQLTKNILDGDLSKRGDAQQFKGGYREIVDNLNKTLDAMINPVKEGAAVLSVMAANDFSVRVTGSYRGDHRLIIDSINHLGESISSVIRDVNSAVSAAASASSQISSSTEEMAAGAHEQTQQASEVAAAVEEMTKTILETTKHAGIAAETARRAGATAASGGEVVKETIKGMNRIAEVVMKSAATTAALGQSSDQIGEIIQVIDDIADQTNLLALNAAIEAARAGEQGRGFAVVADEVRKLAERTTKATKEIAGMIKQIQKDTSGAVESMEQGKREVEAGKQLALRADQSLNEIIEGANNVVGTVTQVAAASEEQSSASEQISKNIEAITAITHESAAGTQQIARAAEDLSRLTENLQTLTSVFKILPASADRHSVDAHSQTAQVSAEKSIVTADDIDAMITGHQLWKLRIKKLFTGLEHIPNEKIGNHRECKLGICYYGEWRHHFSTERFYKDLGSRHEEFHAAIKETVMLWNAGQKDEAFRRGEDVVQLSAAVVALLQDCRTKIL
ncbi:MAG TPA: methyl-accepting chemotaxis protein [Bacteroidota bacterium]|nr:methyl-accepting chemotaxis protein [Bacteroidota bacterium]